MNSKLHKISPFTPGLIVKNDYFVGREEEIEIILRHIPEILMGNNCNFFIVGKTGMGKSSLTQYLKHILETKYDFLVVFVSNSGVDNVDALINNIIESILNALQNKSGSKKVLDMFKDNIESVGFLDMKIKFKPKDERRTKTIKENFAIFLKEIYDNLDDKKPIFIIIDDINGLSKTPEFAKWYKSFANDIDFNYQNKLPIGIVCTSYPETFYRLRNHNPSFARIFNKINMNELKTNETEEFFKKTFADARITYDQEAFDLIVKYSYNMPLMMQEIGYSIYWNLNEETHITPLFAINSIKKASQSISEKYLHEIIKDESYSNILTKISTICTPNKKEQFNLTEIKNNLLDEEEDVLHIFLKEAVKTEVLEEIDYKPIKTYEFVNPLYITYLKIRNLY